MFSLIVVIISIALVAALALATLYFGGDALNRGSDRTIAARAIQEGNQVRGAMELYRADNGVLPTGTPEEIRELLTSATGPNGTTYLRGWPDRAWDLRNDYAVRTDLTQSQCEAVNERLGISGTPSCSDPAIEGMTVCCIVDDEDEDEE